MPFDEVLIYEMHLGSFTPEGTFASAAKKLQHIKSLGFTQVWRECIGVCGRARPLGAEQAGRGGGAERGRRVTRLKSERCWWFPDLVGVERFGLIFL